MSVTTEQVESRVVETLASFGPDASQITRSATFEELDIDSLDLVKLAQVVEEDYGVVLKGEDMKELKTVGDGIELIRERGGQLVLVAGKGEGRRHRARSGHAAWDRCRCPARPLGPGHRWDRRWSR